VSASDDKTLKIWDAGSGACLQTLEDHSHWVMSVAFSQNSTQLASVSWDSTVKVWDASSGMCLQTLEGHSNSVISVAFSHDAVLLASASQDKTVKIWDASSGACLRTINTEESLVKLSSDSTSSCLNTEIGIFLSQNLKDYNIAELTESERSLYAGISLSSDETWIQHSGTNMLWVPTEYRPSCFSVYGSMISVGVGYGRVWSCKIDA
jgi:WD40 repeat protein